MRRVFTMVWPAASARCEEAWIAGPSAMGSENGMPSSMRSAPACGRALSSLSEVVVIGIAGGDEGDEAGAALPLQRGEAWFDATHAGDPGRELAPRVLALR